MVQTCLDKIIKICFKNSKVRFMEVNFRQNVCVGPKIVSALQRLRYESFPKNWSGTNDTVRIREVSALGRFHSTRIYLLLLTKIIKQTLQTKLSSPNRHTVYLYQPK